MAYDAVLLDLITKNLSRAVTNVVEFRHSSWWTKPVFQKLKKESIIFSGISHPLFPDDAIVNSKIAYYRFHGVPRLYYSSYTNKKLRQIADQLLPEKKLKEVYVYFNNTAAPGAIQNATWLKAYVDKASGENAI